MAGMTTGVDIGCHFCDSKLSASHGGERNGPTVSGDCEHVVAWEVEQSTAIDGKARVWPSVSWHPLELDDSEGVGEGLLADIFDEGPNAYETACTLANLLPAQKCVPDEEDITDDAGRHVHLRVIFAERPAEWIAQAVELAKR